MKRKRGFTLIEVIVVVSIIGILLSIAIPPALNQVRKSTERKYYTEAKIVESAIEIYNLDHISSIIKKYDNLYTVKEKLTSSSKKYISSWPSKLKGRAKGVEVEISENSLDSYTLDNIFKYIEVKEAEYK